MKASRLASQSWRNRIACKQSSKNTHIATLPLTKRLLFSSSARMAEQGSPQEYREKYEWIEGVEYLERYDTGGFHQSRM